VAAATMTWTIGDRVWQKSLADTSEMQVMQYGEGKDAVIAAWAVGTTAVPIRNATYRLTLPPGSYLLRNWQGQDQKITMGTEGYGLKLGLMPVYILPATAGG
jgi:polysaccharide biosynthesis protein PslG